MERRVHSPVGKRGLGSPGGGGGRGGSTRRSQGAVGAVGPRKGEAWLHPGSRWVRPWGAAMALALLGLASGALLLRRSSPASLPLSEGEERTAGHIPQGPGDHHSTSEAEEGNGGARLGLHAESAAQQAQQEHQGVLGNALWAPPEGGRKYAACTEPSAAYKRTTRLSTRGYLTAHANGGLNQMRAGICDMVAVARLINATLVVPDLDKSSFWNDSSTFSDIFDTEHLIASLARDVPVVRRLPPELRDVPVGRQHFRSWAPASYYTQEVAAQWNNYRVLRATKTDSRLSNNLVPPDIQKLRCRVQYEALRFAPAMEELGRELVARMRRGGPFLALHLRYEADMLAFTGCTQSLIPAQVEELTAMRLNAKQWKEKDIDPQEQRARGLCPLTPAEVGLFLSALGYLNTTRIYLAAGRIYGGKATMAGLRRYFPILETKETLATEAELRPMARHQNALAALDFLVSVGSDVFVASYPGNMARAVEGHRRFLGHRKTINPDRKQLVRLFDQAVAGQLEKDERFQDQVRKLHKDRDGAPRKRRLAPKGTQRRQLAHAEESFYSNPLPDCICKRGRAR